MTLAIEVCGELEAALKAHARERGLTADGLARRVLARVLTPGVECVEDGLPVAIETSGEAKAQAFVNWAKSHRDTPLLSDEAISRASMYADRC